MTQYYFLIGLGGNVDAIHSMQLDIPAHSKHYEMKYRTYQIMHPHPSASFALSLLHNPKRSPMSCSISKQQPRYKGITQMIYVSLKHPLPQIQQHKTNDLCSLKPLPSIHLVPTDPTTHLPYFSVSVLSPRIRRAS